MTAHTLADTAALVVQAHTCPGGWRIVRLGDVNLATTRSINPQDFPNEVFEYYSIPAFQDTGAPVQEQGKRILSNKLLVEPYTVLFGKLNPRVLKVWMVGSPGSLRAIASTEFLPLLANDEAAPEYLYYVCQSKYIVQEAKRLVNGSTPSRQRVDPASFYDINIPLPPLPEQRAIARVLRAAQEAIAARRREVTVERERKAALMQWLFTHGVRGEPTKQAEIGEMPESWQVVRLGELCDSSAYGPRFSGDLYHVDGNVATLRTTDISDDGAIDYSTMPLAKLDLDRFENHLLKERDFLITRSGTCGIASVFEGFSKPVLPGAFLIRFRLANEKLSPYFLRDYINSSHGRERISSLAVGAVQKNISGSAALMFVVPVPPIEEQFTIVDVAQRMDTHIAALEREIALHEELFRALLEELMSGRLSALGLAMDGSDSVAATAPAS